MKTVRFLCIGLLVMGLVVLLQLPDAAADGPDQRYRVLPEYDVAAAANVAWQAGQKGAAILLLDYAADQRLSGAMACAQQRAGYAAVLQDDATPAGRLLGFGVAAPRADEDWYRGLAGQSVADYFTFGGGTQGWPSGSSQDPFLTLLRETRAAVVAIFPPGGPAMLLTDAARTTGALGAPLAGQLSQALQFVRAEPTNALAVSAVQEAVMPLLQLGRPCRSWAAFQTLLKSADSVDQVKMLTRVAVATPDSARKLAQILAATEAAAPDVSGACVGFVMQHGAAGLDNLHASLARGVDGLRLVLQYPALPAAALNAAAPGVSHAGGIGGSWWLAQQTRHGDLALLAKYAVAALCCAAIFALLVPWTLFRDKFAPASPLAGLGAGHLFRAYWLVIMLAAVAVCLLLALPAVTPPGVPGATADLAPGAGNAAPAGIPVAAAPETRQGISLVLLLLAILIVQGGCYWIARRKIREVELGRYPAGWIAAAGGGDPEPASSAALQLRRLENLDIFFDLPLYCGLALTIFAFILITTFGAGVSRFLAYGSTFVGIVFAVLIRVVHLYPLREKLIHRVAR